MATTSAIIVAAGKGSRMQSDVPKQFLELAQQTVLFHTIQRFLAANCINEIIVVVATEYLQSNYIRQSLPRTSEKSIQLVAGGATRQASVYNGLQNTRSDNQYVLTHDGVRPLIKPAVIDGAVKACQQFDGVIVAVPAIDTLKKVDNTKIVDGIDRNQVWQMQTPQVFPREILIAAFDNASKRKLSVTDESSLVAKLTNDIHIFPGSKTNIKITTPEDLLIAKAILGNDEN